MLFVLHIFWSRDSFERHSSIFQQLYEEQLASRPDCLWFSERKNNWFSSNTQFHEVIQI